MDIDKEQTHIMAHQLILIASEVSEEVTALATHSPPDQIARRLRDLADQLNYLADLLHPIRNPY